VFPHDFYNLCVKPVCGAQLKVKKKGVCVQEHGADFPHDVILSNQMNVGVRTEARGLACGGQPVWNGDASTNGLNLTSG
jgi:hypothetical protein